METSFQSDLDLGCEVGAFVDPPLGADAEIDSFNYQTRAINKTAPPVGLKKAISVMEGIYEDNKWEIPADFGSDAHIARVCKHIMENLGEKSPGAVFIRQGCATNADVFTRFGLVAIVEMVKNRINELLTQDSRYACDPFRLFVKREAHKASKAVEKRWRLIFGVSMIDQVVDRMLYTRVCEASIANCHKNPSKPGFNFKGGGVQDLVTRYDNGSQKWRSFDARSFDWSVPGWGLAAVRDLNESLCITLDEELRSLWVALSRARLAAVTYGTIVFSNGVVLKKTFPCMQASGKFTTIDDNCKLVVLYRVLYNLAHGFPNSKDMIIAMGDDTVQDGIEDGEDFIEWVRVNCGTTFTIESEAGPFTAQNFCSFELRQLANGVWVPVPLNWVKNTYELAHPEKKVCKDADALLENRGSALQSLCIEYCYHDDFKKLHSLLARYCPSKFRSHDFFKSIVLGSEKGGGAAPSESIFGWDEFLELQRDYAAKDD